MALTDTCMKKVMEKFGKIGERSFPYLTFFIHLSGKIFPVSDKNLHPVLKGFLKSSSKSSLWNFFLEAENQLSQMNMIRTVQKNHVRLQRSDFQDFPFHLHKTMCERP